MSDVHLRPGWERIVGRLVASQVGEAARQVADAARSQGITVGDVDGGAHEIPLPVRVYDDEAGSAVVLAHPAGIAVQAKHGTLTRAAAAKGFEVRG